MLKIPHVAGLVVPLITVVLLGPVMALAQPEAVGPVRVAVVDIGRVSNEYQALSEKDQELKQWLAEKQRYREELEDYAFLSEENFNEVLQISELTQPLPEEKATRLEELRNLSADKLKRFLELRANPDRTAEEQENFNSLRDVAEARQQQLAELEQQILGEYGRKLQQARDVLLQEVEKVITQYAQDHGYDLVLDGAWVLFGGEDITDLIIERLNQSPGGGEVAAEEAEETEPTEADQPPEEATEGGEGEEGGGG